MKRSHVPPLGDKGARLLRFLVAEIQRGRIKSGEPKTFVSYSEALRGVGVAARGRAGQQLQREGLTELNEWTKAVPDLPKIAGLIVEKKTWRPSSGFAQSFGHERGDWTAWWLRESERAIAFDWSPYLSRSATAERPEGQVMEARDRRVPDYRKIITIEPGKRGGRPCIRGMRITVGDILGWLAAGMSETEIVDDYSELTTDDVHAALAFAADREKHAVSLATMRA